MGARASARLRAVGVRGFEPPTPCSQNRCATRLRYTPQYDFDLPGRQSLGKAQVFDQTGAHGTHRTRPMRQVILRADPGLGEGAAELRRVEQRVVPEAAGAARLVEDEPLA